MFAQQEGGWGKLRYEAVGFGSGSRKEEMSGDRHCSLQWACDTAWPPVKPSLLPVRQQPLLGQAGMQLKCVDESWWGRRLRRFYWLYSSFFFVLHSNKMRNRKMFDIWPLAGPPDHHQWNEVMYAKQQTSVSVRTTAVKMSVIFICNSLHLLV